MISNILPILTRAFLFVLLPYILLLSSVNAQALKSQQATPPFSLNDIEGKEVSSQSLLGKVVVLEWYNPGCPFVQKFYKVGYMQKLQRDYTAKGVVWLTVNSTSPTHRDYLSPEKMRDLAKKEQIASSHLLIDIDGSLGRLFGAKTTPHLFVLDGKGVLQYQGAIDDKADTSSEPDKSQNYLVAVLNAVLQGKAPEVLESKPYGCSVKY